MGIQVTVSMYLGGVFLKFYGIKGIAWGELRVSDSARGLDQQVEVEAFLRVAYVHYVRIHQRFGEYGKYGKNRISPVNSDGYCSWFKSACKKNRRYHSTQMVVFVSICHLSFQRCNFKQIEVKKCGFPESNQTANRNHGTKGAPPNATSAET